MAADGSKRREPHEPPVQGHDDGVRPREGMDLFTSEREAGDVEGLTWRSRLRPEASN